MMGGTGEADRKRHFSSVSSPTAAATKKHSFEDKKLDTVVLKFQNEKLVQKLESQKVECVALENKFSQLREKQLPYNKTLAVVDKSWNELVDELESCSILTKDLLSNDRDNKHHLATGVGETERVSLQTLEIQVGVRPISSGEMDRVKLTAWWVGAAGVDNESSSPEDVFLCRLIEHGATESSSANNNIPYQLQECRDTTGKKIHNTLHNIVHAINSLWGLKDGLYSEAIKKLPEGSCRPNSSIELENEVKNLRLAIGDTHLIHKSLGNKMQFHHDTDAKNKSELRQLRGELESTIAELEESNKNLTALKAETDAAKGASFPILHGNKRVANDRAREKEKDLHDMESLLKELQDQASSRELEIKRLHEERMEILNKIFSLQSTLKNVKGIFSSEAFVLVKDQIAKARTDIAQYQSIFEKLQVVEKDNLGWREKEFNIKNDIRDVLHQSSAASDSRISDLQMEIQKQIDVRKLIESKLEEESREPGRKEIIAKFRNLVSTFPEDMRSMQTQLRKHKEASSNVHSLCTDVQSLNTVLDRKMKELEALSGRSAAQSAEIQKLHATIHDLEESGSGLKSLKYSLDEHNLETRVKAAIEAESASQQMLAAAEAKIADLRQKLEISKKEKCRLTDVLKSKHEENEAYLSEIETIGQAYDDIQTQNQHLLQQITERDDYNIKLVLEVVRAKQLQASFLLDKQTVEKKIQQGNLLINLCETTAERIQDQYFHLLIVFHRFDKKRVEEELEASRRKHLRLTSHLEGTSAVEKLQQELKEYKEILKCSACLDRPKEKIIESRHRKCPLCAASFGANDVKPVYI
ncbi:hypothetical protein L1987_39370 [Smallanthus sonchifolius]|uniref:Uncharacterized protein n=1 Tax=Smallanthus sonchifolius TaxID=185202 RepID=A0ACB9HN69_9ASTR|nr:hypothetical protein L1987_39370 [Smallanthus sonchifolius]